MSVANVLGSGFDRLLAVLQPETVELSSRYGLLLTEAVTLVDLGCGEGNHLSGVPKPLGHHWLGIDSHERSLQVGLQRGTYDVVECADVLGWLENASTSSFDTVLASCVIEHMPKELGHRLLVEMKRVCARQAIVFTPNGFVPQPPDPDNPANEHVSGWKVTDFKQAGFVVRYGLNGFRGLRTSFANPTIKPRMLGDFLAKLTARPASHLPRLAYQLLAVHTKDDERPTP